MADYCTLAQVREELVKQGTSALDDAAISARIPRATALINAHCQHSFDGETVTNEVRSGDQVLMSPDGELLVSVRKGHCRSVASAEVSHDFKAWTALDLVAMYADFVGPISYVIHFVQPEVPIQRGRRLYARLSYAGGFETVPADLAQAACRWTAFLYHKREAPFEVTAFPDVGQISIPSAVPGDVLQTLDPYVRKRP